MNQDFAETCGQEIFGVCPECQAPNKLKICSTKSRSCRLECQVSHEGYRCVVDRPAFHQRPALREVAPTFSPRTGVACWSSYFFPKSSVTGGNDEFFAKNRSCRLECQVFHESYRCPLERLVLHQRPASSGEAFTFSPETSIAGWCYPSTPPSFAGTPTLLPYGALAFVRSTPTVPTDPAPSAPYGVWGFAVSAPPASLGRPPARRPACLVPSTTGHTPTRLAFSGVSVTSNTPSLGVRPRLSPHPGHDDWNPGQRGFQFLCLQ